MNGLLIAVPSLGRAGPDKVMATVASQLASRGWDVALAIGDGARDLVATLDERVRVLDVPSAGPRLHRRYPVFGLARVLRQEQPDVVLATLRMESTVALAARMYRSRAKVVSRPANHGPSVEKQLGRSPKYRLAFALSRWGLLRSEGVISQCEALADVVRGLGYGGPLAVIGNPVAPGAADVDAVRLAGEPCLVGVGRLTNQKGFDVAVKALPEIVSHFPRTVLHLVGDGPDREALGDLAARHGVAEHVVFHGGRSDVVAAIKGADLLVAPSRYEGFSNVILEAQSVGTPVVATSCPGAARDVLDHTGGGVVVAPDNADELAAAVVGLLAEPDRFDRAIIADRTAERWSADRIAAEYDRFLSEVSDRHDGVTSEVLHG